MARLRIGIGGGGSVGAIIAEALARIGVLNVKLIDFDVVEELNRDRLLHATEENASGAEAKVRMLARALRLSSTAEAFHIDEIEHSICEEEGFRQALDCDVLFPCFDRPWPRAVLNFIAYAHLIPVIDGGILIGVKADGSMRRADWKAHIASPDRRCLECLKQYDPGLVSVERDGYLDLDDPSYVQGLPEDRRLQELRLRAREVVRWFLRDERRVHCQADPENGGGRVHLRATSRDGGRHPRGQEGDHRQGVPRL